MKYGLFSDIHANLEALEVVLADLRLQGAQPVCLGDIVGYNADPGPCLDLVRALRCPVVRGNHDHETAREEAPRHYNALAVEGLRYSRAKLDAGQRAYLGHLPYKAELPGGEGLVHASFDRPEAWRYVTGPAEAARSLAWQKPGLAFFGHTHVPHLFVEDGKRVGEYFYRAITLDPARKYLVNVGSVGQPRDGDPRAGYVLYDDAARTLELRRLPYDVERAQAKIRRAGLPERLAERLREAR